MIDHGRTPERDMSRDAEHPDGREKTKEEMDRELDEALDTFIDRVNKSVDHAEILEAAQKVLQISSRIDSSSEAFVQIDVRDSRRNKLDLRIEVSDSDEVSSELQSDEELGNQIKEDEIGLVDRTIRFWTRAKGVTLFFGIVSAIGIAGAFLMALIAYIQSRPNDPVPDPLGLTPEQRANLKVLIDHWISMDDGALWDQMATFCDQSNPSLQAQVLLMDLIKQFSPVPATPWHWANDNDKWTAIQAVVNAYASFVPAATQSRSRAFYTAIKAYRYTNPAYPTQPTTLARPVAADVVELALYQIINIPTPPITR